MPSNSHGSIVAHKLRGLSETPLDFKALTLPLYVSIYSAATSALESLRPCLAFKKSMILTSIALIVHSKVFDAVKFELSKLRSLYYMPCSENMPAGLCVLAIHLIHRSRSTSNDYLCEALPPLV